MALNYLEYLTMPLTQSFSLFSPKTSEKANAKTGNLLKLGGQDTSSYSYQYAPDMSKIEYSTSTTTETYAPNVKRIKVYAPSIVYNSPFGSAGATYATREEQAIPYTYSYSMPVNKTNKTTGGKTSPFNLDSSGLMLVALGLGALVILKKV